MTARVALTAFWRLLGCSRAPTPPAAAPTSPRRTLVAGRLRNGIYCGGIEREKRQVIRYPDSLLRHQQTEVEVRHRPGRDDFDVEILTAQAAAEYLAFVEPSFQPRTPA